jgi:hypothetical protein
MVFALQQGMDMGGSMSGMDLFGPMMAVGGAMLAIFAIVAIALYIYGALAMMTVAKRLNVANGWLAFIPIANMVLLAKMAKMHWWPVLLYIVFIIPIVNVFLGWLASIAIAVFVIIWTWKVCEARGKPGWWSILVIIPFVGGIWYLIMWGILAWGK